MDVECSHIRKPFQWSFHEVELPRSLHTRLREIDFNQYWKRRKCPSIRGKTFSTFIPSRGDENIRASQLKTYQRWEKKAPTQISLWLDAIYLGRLNPPPLSSLDPRSSSMAGFLAWTSIIFYISACCSCSSSLRIYHCLFIL